MCIVDPKNFGKGQPHRDDSGHSQVLGIIEGYEVEASLCVRVCPDSLGLVHSVCMYWSSTNLYAGCNLRIAKPGKIWRARITFYVEDNSRMCQMIRGPAERRLGCRICRWGEE